MTETIRRSAQEVFELLHDENVASLAGGWVVFDRVGDEWKFMGTSGSDFTRSPDCTYRPSIEIVDSTLNRLMDGTLEMSGIVQTHARTGEPMFFFLPVGSGIYEKE